MTEKAFTQQVMDLARLTGHLAFHVHDSRHSAAGFPDVVVVGKGRLIVRELKVGKNTTTPEQERWIAELRAAGVDAGVWRPEDWKTIEKELMG